jgi:ABC-type antimicrobial peptide transport system permease subunit
VSGIATFPTIGRTKAERTSLGVGAIVVPERVPGRDLDITGAPVDDLGPNVVFIRLVDGAPVDAGATRLRAELAPLVGFVGVKIVGPQRPAEIVNAGSIGGVPLVLGTLLGVGAAVSLASAIAGSIRARRRELAVLKSLGFTARQLASTVSWQATTIAVVGLAIGVPLGVMGGRLAWALFAAKLDVISEPAVPLSRLALVALITLAVANLAAAIPARRARRVDPARILRSE